MSGMIRVSLKQGVIATNERQKKTVLGLGLKYRQASRLLKNNPAIVGMAKKVSHLVLLEQNPSEKKESNPFAKKVEYQLGAVRPKVEKPKKEKKIKVDGEAAEKNSKSTAKASKTSVKKKAAPKAVKKSSTSKKAKVK